MGGCLPETIEVPMEKVKDECQYQPGLEGVGKRAEVVLVVGRG